MNKYRISKYNPKYRNQKGVFLNNEWTSYWDIGKTYSGKIFYEYEYLNIEKLYCNCIISILKTLEINKMIINNLEKHSLDKREKEVLKSLDALNVFYNIKNNLIINIDNIYILLQLLLREILWCKLKTTSNFKIVIGYDMYVYIYCDNIPFNIIEYYKKTSLFIEKL